MNNHSKTTAPLFNPGDRVRVIKTDERGTVGDISGGWIVVLIDGIEPGHGFRAADLERLDRCASFCDRKEIHAAEPNYDDGSCWSADQSTALNVEPFVMGMPIIFDIGAFREADNTESVVSLTTRSTGHYQGVDFKITADEARRIAASLVRAADLVEGDR
ncbi:MULTISPECIES: hypothetical protein [Nocardia]|uniref:hypothetical protein n=1 Tax=Nocardia TaxID=1817 RepID=UPI000D68F445|nr:MULTISPECIES: hypothetical protein [Nocardia]